MPEVINFGDPRLPERFWSKVQPCPTSGCWLWTGAKRFYPDSNNRNRGLMPRRAVYEVSNPRLPLGKKIVCGCGVDICCSPAHLRVGIDTGDAMAKAAYSRRWRLRREYGISVADYERMLAEQRGRCAICSRKFKDTNNGKPRIDHCHRTGKVRGLLCNNCNAGIGSLGEDVFVISNALTYVFKHNGMPKDSVEE